MELQLSDKTVQINIPSKVKWLDPPILQILIDKGVFDDSEKIADFSELISEYDRYPNHYMKEVKTLGIWCSGGADSSILLYCLAKKIKDENLNYKIQPLSVRRGRPWNPVYASNVVDFIKNDLNAQDIINNIIIYYPNSNDPHQTEFKEFLDRDTENFNKGIVDIMFSGITMNPPPDSGVSLNKERNRDFDADRPLVQATSFRYFINPFFDIHKKHIAEIYDKFNLTDTLFPLTRSCEGLFQDTRYYTRHCGKCWWCEERMWAFGRLV